MGAPACCLAERHRAATATAPISAALRSAVTTVASRSPCASSR